MGRTDGRDDPPSLVIFLIDFQISFLGGANSKNSDDILGQIYTPLKLAILSADYVGKIQGYIGLFSARCRLVASEATRPFLVVEITRFLNNKY